LLFSQISRLFYTFCLYLLRAACASNQHKNKHTKKACKKDKNNLHLNKKKFLVLFFLHAFVLAHCESNQDVAEKPAIQQAKKHAALSCTILKRIGGIKVCQRI